MEKQTDKAVGSGWNDADDAFDPNLDALANASTEENEHEPHIGHVHQDIFHQVHGKSKKRAHIQEHGFHLPVKFSHLVKRPVVRQWIHDGLLYREKGERLPSRFELFFDLMFVGIAHVLADGAVEQATGFNILKFVLEYFPSWSVWMDLRTFLNMSGTDDVTERLALLASMILLAGYSANATALHIIGVNAGAEVPAEGGTIGIHLATHPESERPCDFHDKECRKMGYYLGHGYWLESGYESAIHAAIAFYLVLRLCRVLSFLYYGWMLPNFRPSMWMHATVGAIISVIYIPIMFVWSPALIVCLMFVGMCLEMLNPFIVLTLLKCVHQWTKRWNKKSLFIPALSLEHTMERTVQFVIVVIGEMIISSTFVASEDSYGLSPKFGRSSMAICIAFLIIWLYYDADSSRTFQHALRRHSITSALYTAVHFPLTASLILGGSSLGRLIKSTEDSQEFTWFLSGSCCTALICISFIAVLHRNLDLRGSTLFPRWTRIAMRVLVALIILFLPLMRETWKSIDFMATCAGLLFFLVAFETVTKVGAVGRRFDQNKSNLVLRAKRNRSALSDPKKAASIRQARSELLKLKAIKNITPEGGIPDINKRLYLHSNLSWHPYEGLTLAETGEEDVGMEGELGHLQTKKLSSGQRWAYIA